MRVTLGMRMTLGGANALRKTFIRKPMGDDGRKYMLDLSARAAEFTVLLRNSLMVAAASGVTEQNIIRAILSLTKYRKLALEFFVQYLNLGDDIGKWNTDLMKHVVLLFVLPSKNARITSNAWASLPRSTPMVS